MRGLYILAWGALALLLPACVSSSPSSTSEPSSQAPAEPADFIETEPMPMPGGPTKVCALVDCSSRRGEVIYGPLTGEADYLLRIFCADLAALNRLVQQVLLPHPAVSRVQSQIVMDKVKPDAPLPL